MPSIRAILFSIGIEVQAQEFSHLLRNGDECYG